MTKTMIVYWVHNGRYNWDDGRYLGERTLGYFTSRAKAERVAAEEVAYANEGLNRYTHDKDVDIDELEVDTEA